MRRDVGSELTVAIAALGILAFALMFGIILSLSSTSTTDQLAVLISTTPHDLAQVIAPLASPTERAAAQLPTQTPTVGSMTEDDPRSATLATSAAEISPARTSAATPTARATAVAQAAVSPMPATTSTPTLTVTLTSTSVPTQTASPTVTPTVKPSSTAAPSAAPSVTATSSPTAAPSATATPSATMTASATPTQTFTATAPSTATHMLTPALTSTAALLGIALVENYIEQDSGILPTPTPFAPYPVTDCLPPAGWSSYIVQSGNTLFAIAQAVGSTVGELRDANCLQNVDNILTGDYLFVPRPPLLPVATIRPRGAPPFETFRRLRPQGCTHPSTSILSPMPGDVINGVFTVFGTANLDNLAYYKLEIRPDFTSTYNFYDRYEAPVVADALGQINSRLFDDGLYWLRLTVVDTTGNFPPPCDIPLIFRSGSR